MFRPLQSTTGTIRVTWTADPGREARLWLLLADPSRLTPDDLHPQRLLPHLIRIPVEDGSRVLTVHVPVGRALGLCIVGRDANDAPQSILPDSCVDTAPEPVTIDSAKREPAPPETPRSAPTDTPFVLAPGASREAVSALAARLASAAPTPPPAPTGPTGFGLRQKWYLSRIGFDAPASDAPRVAIRRTTFIDARTLAAWSDAPPPDAIPLPPGCDGIVDAETDDETMAFFVVLEGPAPWHPVPLEPVSPPFDAVTRPMTLGDARGRLDAVEARSQSASPAFHDLLAAARRTLA